MKKLIAIAAIAAVFASCAKEPAVKNEAEPGGDSNQRKSLTINMPTIAVPVDVADLADGSTRTAFGTESAGVMPVVWSAGDQIAVIQDKGLGSQKISIYELDGPGGTASGTFSYVSGDASAADADIKDIIYPASAAASYAIPTAQTYTAANVNPAAQLMTWHSDTGIGVAGVTLAPASAVVCLQLKGIVSLKVSSIKVTLNSNDYTLTCSPAVAMSDTAVPFYISVPACSKEDVDFLITFDNGKSVKKASLSKTFETGKLHRFPEVLAIDTGDLFEGGIVYWSDKLLSDSWVEVVSLDETELAFSTVNYSSTLGTVTTSAFGTGIFNTDVIVNTEDYKTDSNNFPAMKWCKNHGAEWFLPSAYDLRNICNMLFIDDWKTDGRPIGKTRGEGLFTHFGATWYTNDAYYMSSEQHTSQLTKYRTRQLPSKSVASFTMDTSQKVRACKRITLG